MADPSLWEEIAGYLLNCGHTGRAMLSEVSLNFVHGVFYFLQNDFA